MTLFSLYKLHLKDYDLDSVVEITHAPKDLIVQLAEDIATIKPAALHQGEGINHWFHATQMNRAAYLPFMLTGNIGKRGAGVYAWAGNYKAALFRDHPGPGLDLKDGWPKIRFNRPLILTSMEKTSKPMRILRMKSRRIGIIASGR